VLVPKVNRIWPPFIVPGGGDTALRFLIRALLRQSDHNFDHLATK
jgi:hypothetical protein